ncbi:MAG: DDE-type integrase/transposase/recombinase [Acidobacteriota bacterium]|nr:DDE-type integrase/transposase/recombinase [Acidobacteriota bacterium]
MNNIVNLQPGAAVEAGGKHYVITHLLDLETVLAREAGSKKSARLYIRDLAPISREKEMVDDQPDTEISLVSDEDWQEANRRFGIIRPLLCMQRRTKEGVAEVACGAGVHISTLYRWIELYERNGLVSALLPGKRGCPQGKVRLSPEVEAIIQATIEDFYLHKQKRSVQKTCDEVARRCRNANVPPPHPNTVRNRIALVSEQVRLKRRTGGRAVKEKFTPLIGHFPGADYPLSVVQIDHTPLDIILVDDLHRRPVGRPWITVAIDVFSRMIAGFYVSLDPPGSLAVGLTIAHAILPKEQWLARHEITTEWPLWGVMKTIHADNAKEFRGNMLKRACEQHGINLEWRPVATPSYGGHIERLLGTFATEIHALPGTTFSSIQERGEYESEKQAAMTLRELEGWLATFITGVYHQRVHKGIGTSPIKRYEQGILGTPEQPGTGLPARITDEDRLRLDFMPYIERTIQQYGVVIDDIHYYSDVLRRWINAPDPKDPHLKRKFVFKRDPRDISQLYFYDPEVGQYSVVPYRDASRPPISIWEMREARRSLADEGRKDINEDLIFESYARMRSQEEQAVRETKRMRRARERRTIHQQASKPMTSPNKTQADALDNQGTAASFEIKPFDEIEDL